MFQFIFGRYVNVFGIFPNLILIVVVYLGGLGRIIYVELIGFLFGLMWDVFSVDIFGVRALMFTVIGYLVGKFCGDFNFDKIFAQFVVVLFANVVYWFCFELIHFIIIGKVNYMLFFVDVLCCMKIIVTVLATPIVFYVLGLTDDKRCVAK
jgi:rod shape-determining protein MreD